MVRARYEEAGGIVGTAVTEVVPGNVLVPTNGKIAISGLSSFTTNQLMEEDRQCLYGSVRQVVGVSDLPKKHADRGKR